MGKPSQLPSSTHPKHCPSHHLRLQPWPQIRTPLPEVSPTQSFPLTTNSAWRALYCLKLNQINITPCSKLFQGFPSLLELIPWGSASLSLAHCHPPWPLMFPEYSNHIPASGPLHLLVPQNTPLAHVPWLTETWLRSLTKYHLLKEVLLDHWPKIAVLATSPCPLFGFNSYHHLMFCLPD